MMVEFCTTGTTDFHSNEMVCRPPIGQTHQTRNNNLRLATLIQQTYCQGEQGLVMATVPRLVVSKLTAGKGADAIRSWHSSARRHLSDKSSTSTKGLDTFLSHLGGNRRKSRRRRRREKTEDQKTVLHDIQPKLSDDGEIKRVNMSSFFDEVNEIMKKSQEKDADQKARPPRVPPPPPPSEDKYGVKKEISILDLLPRSQKSNPDAFEEDAFRQYLEILEPIVENRKFLKKKAAANSTDAQIQAVVEWLKAEEPIVETDLGIITQIMDGEDFGGFAKNRLQEDIMKQKESFLKSQEWSDTQYEMAVGALFQLGNQCAKHAAGPPIEVAWQKAKEAGCFSSKKMIETYLYVSSTFCAQSSPMKSARKGSILDFLDTDIDESEEVNDVELVLDEGKKGVDTAAEIAFCQDTMYAPTEHSINLRVRMLVSKGKARDAELLLESNPVEDLRLRTHDPVFQFYLDQGDVPSALRVYTKMKSIESVHMRPETYIHMIALVAEKGYFETDAKAIEGAAELGYPVTCGPALFDYLVSELAEEVVEISAASAKRLHNALQKGFKNNDLKKMNILESFEVCHTKAGAQEVVSSRVTIDEATGRCPRTGIQLRLINLDSEQKEKLQEGLLYLSNAAYQERSGKTILSSEGLHLFEKWLKTRKGPPFTAVVDGPNVGYYFQNFEQGTFNFHQIKFVIDALENMGENVLLILPRKYTQKSFMLTQASGKSRQYVTKKEREILESLMNEEKVFVVPPSFLDDYYWMYASVCSQGDKWTEEVQYISPNNPDGRWPGIRPMLISNDKMRDHKLSLLEPRLFRRWYSNFLVNFTFSAFIGDQCVDKEIGFSTADFYSKEIQRNHRKDGDSMSSPSVWHFPVSDWGDDESFCIQIPTV